MSAILNMTRTDRLYKGTAVFKWEDNPGLGHHCGVCAKPFTKDSCKVTCVAKHAEPCYRYHQILHFLGKAHECSPCLMSDQMHHSRHKDILTLVRKIKELDQAEANRVAPYAKKQDEDSPSGMRRRRSLAEATVETDSDLLSEPSRLSKREKKRQRRSGGSAGPTRVATEVFTKDDMEFVDEALHFLPSDGRALVAPSTNDPPRRPGTRNAKEVMRLPRSNTTSSNQKSSHYVNNSRTAYLSKIHRHGNQGKSSRLSKRNLDICGEVDSEIFSRLGVELVSPYLSSRRKELVVKLVEAVKNDLEVVDQEEVEAHFRELAFYRWAGRGARIAMEEAHKNYDWATGLLSKNYQTSDVELPNVQDTINETEADDPHSMRRLANSSDELQVEGNSEDPGLQIKNVKSIAGTTRFTSSSTPIPSTATKRTTPNILRIVLPPKVQTPRPPSRRSASPFIPKPLPPPTPIFKPRKPKIKKQPAPQQDIFADMPGGVEPFDPEDLEFLIEMRARRMA
ncbi:hypothetical protein PVAG01_00906 [Phlyctema vagabunda]|uniref:Uncharacterized protein n=1 Tax=Phlyctema vagabunda TaxID=108571 RepID=A0ABR4PVM3_9HELO